MTCPQFCKRLVHLRLSHLWDTASELPPLVIGKCEIGNDLGSSYKAQWLAFDEGNLVNLWLANRCNVLFNEDFRECLRHKLAQHFLLNGLAIITFQQPARDFALAKARHAYTLLQIVVNSTEFAVHLVGRDFDCQ